MAGPLSGLKIIEIASLGPGPFCGMMLADHGAEVIQVERPREAQTARAADLVKSVLNRSRRSICIDLKKPRGRAVLLDLARSADGLIEGFRPGVMERLGLSPAVLHECNPKLVYGRMTGWGQSGPYAAYAGHDINYVALSGVLDLLGRAEGKPTPPINLLGDFGGGGMMLAFALLAGILHARQSGHGQVIDCSMVEGSALLSSMIWGLHAQGRWSGPRGTNLLDTGAHFYDTYECADGKHIAIGAIEPKFYAELRRRIGAAVDSALDNHEDSSTWAPSKEKLTKLFKSQTRAYWCGVLERTDACFAPVLSMAEAPTHAHNAARASFVEIDGVVQPAPAPRYSLTQTALPTMPGAPGKDTAEILRNLNYTQADIDDLGASGIVE